MAGLARTGLCAVHLQAPMGADAREAVHAQDRLHAAGAVPVHVPVPWGALGAAPVIRAAQTIFPPLAGW